ncbi:MAG: hypothetical protein RSA09_07135 [Acinetobacter sp.]
MDLQKENNLVQEAFEVEADEVGFCLDQKWGDYENPYESSDTALAFNLFKKAWQAAKAQAVQQGFVLVPKEPTQAMLDAFPEVEYEDTYCGTCHIWVDDLTLTKGYKAMLEAAREPANDL